MVITVYTLNTITAIVIGIILIISGKRKIIKTHIRMTKFIDSYIKNPSIANLEKGTDEREDTNNKLSKWFPIGSFTISLFLILFFGNIYIELAIINTCTYALNKIANFAPWGMGVLFTGCVFYILGCFYSSITKMILHTLYVRAEIS